MLMESPDTFIIITSAGQCAMASFIRVLECLLG